MAATAPENAIRNYLTALRDPASLRDDKKIADLRAQLEAATDEIERLRLRQAIIDAQSPSLDSAEEAFVAGAKEWAARVGITERAFLEEGVPPQVLRRAGFKVAGGRGRPAGRSAARSTGRTRSRVSAETVRAAIPRGAFTIKQLQAASGASPAVVRKVVQEEEAAGNLVKAGTEPSAGGPGRTPTLYKRK